MIRILHVIGRMGAGGAEALLMNLFRSIDRTRIQFDFVVHTEEKQFYDDEIEALGGVIYRTRRFNITNYSWYRKWWNDFFDHHHEYFVVHGHINSSAAVYLSCAKKHGIITIAHSHNTKSRVFSLRTVAFSVFSFPLRYIADYFFACSKQAGIDRYGRKIADDDRFRIVLNGIESKKYSFSPEKRRHQRINQGIDNKQLIIGHVGRFSAQKNHRFLINVFEAVRSRVPTAQLWLIGDGELFHQIERIVEEKGLQNAVTFLGVTDKVNIYLQAMDVFVFPSIFEGLGIALVEAQAAGLPCVVSDAIQEEADIGAGLIIKKKLSDSCESWADAIIKSRNDKREDTSVFVEKAGYDIEYTAKWIQDFYCNITNGKQ